MNKDIIDDIVNSITNKENLNMSNLIVISSDSKDIFSKSIYKSACRKNTKCIFVSYSKTYENLKKAIDNNTDEIKILDCISQNDNEFMISSPDSLTELSIKINNIIVSNNIDYFILDSIDNMLRYNTKSDVERFIVYLKNRLTSYNIKSIYFLYENKENLDTLENVSQTVDKVHHI